MTALSYRTQREKDADRDRLRELLQALSASELALRLDECDAWRINGKRGHLYTWNRSGGWLLFIACSSTWGWTSAKRRLSFCEVTQDGDDEGCMRLRELPTSAQAKVIRSILGIRKRKSALVATNLSRQKVLKVPTEGEKSTLEPRSACGGYHPTGETADHEFGGPVEGSQEEAPRQAGHRLYVGVRS